MYCPVSMEESVKGFGTNFHVVIGISGLFLER